MKEGNWVGEVKAAQIKSQITNHKFQINPNDQNSKSQTVSLSLSAETTKSLCFGHWILEFEIYL
jgi:hypothetical protein